MKATIGICASALAVTMSARAVDVASCPLHVETFGSFAGPAGADVDGFRVRWCAAGAVVAGNSFCNTGGALRLSSSTQDPVLWVDVGKAGCAAIELKFDYSQFADTGTLLRFAVGNDAELNCAESILTTAAALNISGGSCVTVTHTVPLVGPGVRSVYWKFDHGQPSGNAIFIDNVRLTRLGCCEAPPHSCCEIGAPGCENRRVSQCICAVDPFCCVVEWDQQCVDEVDDFGCGSCAPVSDCAVELSAGFGTLFIPGAICRHFPELFEYCEGTGPFMGSGNACGSTGDQTMRFGTGFPYSAAVTKCLDFSAAGTVLLGFNYTKQAGTLGPKLEIAVNDEPFAAAWSAPISFSGGCVPVLLDFSAWSGESNVRFRFSSGSSVSNGAAIDDIQLMIQPPSIHECCEVGPAGCADSRASSCVCASDPFCCAIQWDELCVLEVGLLKCGRACQPQPIPGDFNGDAAVNGIDLGILLSQWATKGSADLNDDGTVNGIDLGILLANWTA